MRETEGERELLALEHRAVSGTADLEVLGESGRHAGDHVREQRPGETVERAVLLRVVRPLHRDLSILALDLHVLVERARELALGAFHVHGLTIDLDVDPARDGHRESSDPAHALPTKPDQSVGFAEQPRSRLATPRCARLTGAPAPSLLTAKPLVARLPDICQDLAAEALALRFAAGHEAGRGRDDGDAETAEHARHLVLPRVDAKPWL